MGEIHVGRDHIAEGAHCLDLRLHGEQHAPNVRMMNDRDSFAALLAERAALDSLLGEVARLLIRTLGDPQTLQPDLVPRLVHHREHVREALILLADEITDGPQ